VFFVAPIVIVALYSFNVYSLFQGPHGFTFDAWRAVAHNHIYLRLFWKSTQMSLIVSVIIVLLAYPVAYYLALSGTKRKYILLLLLIAPFLTSYLLRVLAWKVILGDQGVVNSFLFWTHLRSPEHPLSQLLYSRFAVMLVLGYIWLPFVALPIFVSLESLDRRLLEAASDLGASRLRAFWAVTLPLSLPGVIAGVLLCFIPIVGEFVIPDLLGSSQSMMIGQTLWTEFFLNKDWPVASSIAIVLLAVLLTPILFYQRMQTRDPSERA
jgi:ABC-type spermidine/putrescine transport system permease subunit I